MIRVIHKTLIHSHKTYFFKTFLKKCGTCGTKNKKGGTLKKNIKLIKLSPCTAFYIHIKKEPNKIEFF